MQYSLSLSGTIHSVLVNLLVIAQWHSVSEIVLTGRGDEANFNKNNTGIIVQYKLDD
jgi:hypothetical protein